MISTLVKTRHARSSAAASHAEDQKSTQTIKCFFEFDFTEILDSYCTLHENRGLNIGEVETRYTKCAKMFTKL